MDIDSFLDKLKNETTKKGFTNSVVTDMSDGLHPVVVNRLGS